MTWISLGAWEPVEGDYLEWVPVWHLAILSGGLLCWWKGADHQQNRTKTKDWIGDWKKLFDKRLEDPVSFVQVGFLLIELRVAEPGGGGERSHVHEARKAMLVGLKDREPSGDDRLS
jgi:hypothetical protein